MKILVLTALLVFCGAIAGHADDARFRFHHGEGVTGIPNNIADAEGTVTTIVFSEDSNPTASFILNSLLSQEGVWGAHGPKRELRGITWDQGIIVIGSFASSELMTASNPNGAAREPYKEFKLSKVEIELPFAQWIQTDKDDPISSPYVVVYHFGLDSLFPKGLEFHGKSLDLSQYETKSKSEQGGTGQPATRPESKSEDGDNPQPEAEGRSR